MNIVVHMTECKPESTIASAKVARFISKTLELPIIDTKVAAASFKEPIDNLIIVNGPMAFCDFLPELADLVRNSYNVIWVQQDYTIMPPKADSKAESPFRKVFADLNMRPTFWTTCHENIKTPYDKYINWNQLTYNLKPLHIATKNKVLYYGAFREKRLPSFARYFKEPTYPLAISTTTIRAKKFRALGTGEVFVPPFADVISESSRYAAALYIEDEKSHKSFHSPANRFYEMLSAGVPIFFDYECDVQLSNAGIHVPSAWKVADKKELAHKFGITDLGEMRYSQRELWAKDYTADLTNQLLKAWNDK